MCNLGSDIYNVPDPFLIQSKPDFSYFLLSTFPHNFSWIFQEVIFSMKLTGEVK